MVEYNKQKNFETRIQKLLTKMEKLNKQHQEHMSQQNNTHKDDYSNQSENTPSKSNRQPNMTQIIEGLRMGYSFAEQQKFTYRHRPMSFNSDRDFERRNVFKRLRKSQRNIFQHIKDKGANVSASEKMLQDRMQKDLSDSRNERQMNWRERKRLYTRVRGYERSR